jgi:ABC-2 type transport system permease protein
MPKRQQYISLYTIIRREWMRMLRIAGQVFLPPVITMSLYFLIFGELIGPRIGEMDKIPYSSYIAPGLIMMSVITNSYANVASSFYGMRFQKNVEELLVSPTPNLFILIGFVAGGVLRGLSVAFLVLMVTLFFIPLHVAHPWLMILAILMVSSFFSLAGFTNAMLARNFDDIMLIPTFILTPLTYLGGVFYSINMLPSFWHKLSMFNPVLYMVNAFRYGMLGVSDIEILPALCVLFVCIIALGGFNLHCLDRGLGIKD